MYSDEVVRFILFCRDNQNQRFILTPSKTRELSLFFQFCIEISQNLRITLPPFELILQVFIFRQYGDAFEHNDIPPMARSSE